MAEDKVAPESRSANFGLGKVEWDPDFRDMMEKEREIRSEQRRKDWDG